MPPRPVPRYRDVVRALWRWRRPHYSPAPVPPHQRRPRRIRDLRRLAGPPAIAVSLLDWLRTGRFGPLRLGMTRAQVGAILGPLDDHSGRAPMGRLPSIWKYGDIEFHFGDGGQLCAIHTDTFLAAPSGGRAIALDPWILRARVQRAKVEQALTDLGIPFERAPWPFDDNTTRIRVGPCVELGFVDRRRRHAPPPGLVAIGCAVRP